MKLPTTETITLNLDGPVLHITLNRPESRNAMSLTMVNELMAVFESVAGDTTIRAIVLRGTGGHFCAGGDIKDMAGARQQAAGGDDNAFQALNRRFGEMITAANRPPPNPPDLPYQTSTTNNSHNAPTNTPLSMGTTKPP